MVIGYDPYMHGGQPPPTPPSTPSAQPSSTPPAGVDPYMWYWQQAREEQPPSVQPVAPITPSPPIDTTPKVIETAPLPETLAEQNKNIPPNLVGGKQLNDAEREFEVNPSWKPAEKNAEGVTITYVDDKGTRWYTPENIQYKYYGVRNSEERMNVERVEYQDPQTGETIVRFEGGAGRYADPTTGRDFVAVMTNEGTKLITLREADLLLEIENQDDFDGQIRSLLNVKEGTPVLPLEPKLASKIGDINLMKFVEAGIDQPEDYKVAGYKVTRYDIDRTKDQLANFKRQFENAPREAREAFEKAKEIGTDEYKAFYNTLSSYNTRISRKFKPYEISAGVYDFSRINEDYNKGKIEANDLKELFGEDAIKNIDDVSEYNQLVEEEISQQNKNLINSIADKYNIKINDVDNITMPEMESLITTYSASVKPVPYKVGDKLPIGAVTIQMPDGGLGYVDSYINIPQLLIASGYSMDAVNKAIGNINSRYEAWQQAGNKLKEAGVFETKVSIVSGETGISPVSGQVTEGLALTGIKTENVVTIEGLAKYLRKHPEDAETIRNYYGDNADETIAKINEYNTAKEKVLNTLKEFRSKTPKQAIAANSLAVTIAIAEIGALPNEDRYSIVDKYGNQTVPSKRDLNELIDKLSEEQFEKAADIYARNWNREVYFSEWNALLEKGASELGLLGGLITAPVLPITHVVAKQLTINDARKMLDDTYNNELGIAKNYRNNDGTVDLNKLKLDLDTNNELKGKIKELGYENTDDYIANLEYYNNGIKVTGEEWAIAGATAALDVVMFGGAGFGGGLAGRLIIGGVSIGSGAIFLPSTIRAVKSPDVSGLEKGVAIGGEVLLLAGGAFGLKGGKISPVDKIRIPAKEIPIVKTIGTIPEIEQAVSNEISKLRTTSTFIDAITTSRKFAISTSESLKNLPSATLTRLKIITNDIDYSLSQLGDAIKNNPQLVSDTVKSTIKNLELKINNAKIFMQELPDNVRQQLSNIIEKTDIFLNQVKTVASDSAKIAANDIEYAVSKISDAVKQSPELFKSSIDNAIKETRLAVDSAYKGLQNIPSNTKEAINNAVNELLDKAQILQSDIRTMTNMATRVVSNDMAYALDRVVQSIKDTPEAVIKAAKDARNLLELKLREAGLSIEATSKIAWNELDNALNKLIEIAENTPDKIKEYADNVDAAFFKVRKEFDDFLKSLPDNVKDLRDAGYNKLIELRFNLEDIGSTISDNMKIAYNDVYYAINKVVDTIKKQPENAKNLINELKNTIQKAKQNIENAPEYIRDVWESTLIKLEDLVDTVNNNIVTGMKATGDAAKIALEEIRYNLDKITDTIKSSPQNIKSIINKSVDDMRGRVEYYKTAIDNIKTDFKYELERSDIESGLREKLVGLQDKLKKGELTESQAFEELYNLKNSEAWQRAMNVRQINLQAQAITSKVKTEQLQNLVKHVSVLESKLYSAFRNAILTPVDYDVVSNMMLDLRMAIHERNNTKFNSTISNLENITNNLPDDVKQDVINNVEELKTSGKDFYLRYKGEGEYITVVSDLENYNSRITNTWREIKSLKELLNKVEKEKGIPSIVTPEARILTDIERAQLLDNINKDQSLLYDLYNKNGEINDLVRVQERIRNNLNKLSQALPENSLYFNKLETALQKEITRLEKLLDELILKRASTGKDIISKATDDIDFDKNTLDVAENIKRTAKNPDNIAKADDAVKRLKESIERKKVAVKEKVEFELEKSIEQILKESEEIERKRQAGEFAIEKQEKAIEKFTETEKAVSTEVKKGGEIAKVEEELATEKIKPITKFSETKPQTDRPFVIPQTKVDTELGIISYPFNPEYYPDEAEKFRRTLKELELQKGYIIESGTYSENLNKRIEELSRSMTREQAIKIALEEFNNNPSLFIGIAPISESLASEKEKTSEKVGLDVYSPPVESVLTGIETELELETPARPEPSIKEKTGVKVDEETKKQPIFAPEFVIPIQQERETTTRLPKGFIHAKDKDGNDVTLEVKSGSICWIQGRPMFKGGTFAPMFKILVPPYGDSDLYSSRETPPDYTDEGYKGKGSAKKSLQIIGSGGLPPDDIENIDLGWAKINIRVIDGKPVIEYVQDVEANSGERSETIGQGKGQIPIEVWKEAKRQGISKEQLVEMRQPETQENEMHGIIENPVLIKKPKNFKNWWDNEMYEETPVRKVKTKPRLDTDNYYLGHKLLNPDVGGEY